MNDCQKCFKKLQECSGCHGQPNRGGLTCSRCNNTGYTCPTHGGHHTR